MSASVSFRVRLYIRIISGLWFAYLIEPPEKAQCWAGHHTEIISTQPQCILLLPATLNDLVPMSFIGQAAVTYYKAKIKVMDQLKMTEAQRKATLRDGQDAGEMFLDIEARIGELLPESGENLKKYPRIKGRTVKPTGADPTIGSGLSEKKRRDAKAIAKNPDIVKKIKAQASENEDIPTKVAVLNAINYKKEMARMIIKRTAEPLR